MIIIRRVGDRVKRRVFTYARYSQRGGELAPSLRYRTVLIVTWFAVGNQELHFDRWKSFAALGVRGGKKIGGGGAFAPREYANTYYKRSEAPRICHARRLHVIFSLPPLNLSNCPLFPKAEMDPVAAVNAAL